MELMSKIGLNPAKPLESLRIPPISSPSPQGPLGPPKLSNEIPSPSHPDLDEAVFCWFERNRHQGLFISCARLKSEATSLNKQLSPISNFTATEQWLSCWKARYGIRYLPETLEKVTTDKMGEKEFRIEVNRVLRDGDLRKCQVFNCCEVSWSWKNLPRRSPAGTGSLEHSTGDYVTVMGFCNADFSLKLPLVVLRRPGNVQVLENKNNLPLYSIERNEPWMFSSVLGNWFRKDFVPVVTKFLEERQLPPKAILIVDDTRFLPTNLWFGDFKIVFLPRNSTCLMRPFYQKLENIKTHCKKTLILSLALHMDCDKSKGVRRHLQGSITIVNLLNWIYTAWENNKGEKPRQVLESLKSIDGFKDFTVEELNEWLRDSEEDEVAGVLEGEEAVEIVQTPDMTAYGDEEGASNGEVITPSDAVRYLDCVIEFFCHCRNLSETDLAALRLARETANNISV
ncbi:tigger transposable element-derived protein 7 [Diachasma alloeum]|uniref:tigger transposable element-derived protein 7 n=1 Tax=Diachasma alloeum TaxID=454923 RepID=UPI0007382FF9|nr:tigger transposable element-derived protein 7 [Diachasma alloeum]